MTVMKQIFSLYIHIGPALGPEPGATNFIILEEGYEHYYFAFNISPHVWEYRRWFMKTAYFAYWVQPMRTEGGRAINL